MTFQKKTKIALIVVGVVLCLPLAACGAPASDSSGNNENTPENENSISADIEAVEDADVADYEEPEVSVEELAADYNAAADKTQGGNIVECARWFKVRIPENMFYSEAYDGILPTDYYDDHSIYAYPWTYEDDDVSGFEEAVSQEEEMMRDSWDGDDAKVERSEMTVNGKTWTCLGYESEVDGMPVVQTVLLVPFDDRGYISIDATFGKDSPELKSFMETFEVIADDPYTAYREYVESIAGDAEMDLGEDGDGTDDDEAGYDDELEAETEEAE